MLFICGVFCLIYNIRALGNLTGGGEENLQQELSLGSTFCGKESFEGIENIHHIRHIHHYTSIHGAAQCEGCVRDVSDNGEKVGLTCSFSRLFTR